MRKILRYALLVLVVFAAQCDHIEYNLYDTNVHGDCNINAHHIAQIEARCRHKSTIRFVMISDTHRQYDDTHDAVRCINALHDIDFVIHGGDLSDFGTKQEMVWLRDILSQLSVPYVCVLGNHDCLGTGDRLFQKIFGDPDFAFTAGHTRFVCLNTNAIEYNYADHIPNFQFMAHEAQRATNMVEHTVFAMHVRPFEYAFNNRNVDRFREAISAFPDPLFCIFGHDHRWQAEDLYHDGLMWYCCPNIEKRIYLIFTIENGDYSYEKIAY